MKKLFLLIILCIFTIISVFSVPQQLYGPEYKKYINISTGKFRGSENPDTVTRDILVFEDKEISHEFLNNFITITTRCTGNPKNSKFIATIGLMSGYSFNDTILIYKETSRSIFCLDSITRGNGDIRRLTLRLYIPTDEDPDLQVSYTIKIMSSILPIRALIYLFAFIILTVIIYHYLKWENFSKLAEADFSKGTRKTIKNTVSILTQVFLAILILDETGLLLKEAGVSSSFLSIFRHIMELPGVSQLVLLANLSLIIPAGYSLSSVMIDKIKEFNEDRITEWDDFKLYRNRYSLAISILILTITLFFFVMQCFVYNEFGFNDNGLIIYLIYDGSVFILPVVLMFCTLNLLRRISKENNPYRNKPWLEKGMLIITFLTLFLSLTQTMITKVIFLLSVANWTIPVIKKYVGKVMGRLVRISSDYTPLSYENTYRIVNASDLLKIWNFFFLTTSFLPLILLFQAFTSPYPPTDSAFPMSETISALYMLFMVSYLFIDSGKYIILKSVIWWIMTVFILYVTPLIFYDWYFPPVIPPGDSFLSIMETMTSLLTTMVYLFLLHIIINFSAIGLYLQNTLKSRLEESNFKSVKDFKRFFLLSTLSSEPVYFFVFPATAFLTSTSSIWELGRFAYRNRFMELNPAIGECFLLAVPALVICYFSFRKSHDLQEMRSWIKETSGEESIIRLRKEFGFLNNFIQFNPGSKRWKSRLIFLMPSLLLILTTSGFLYIPLLTVKEHSLLVYHEKSKNDEGYISKLHLAGDKVLFNSNRYIRSYNAYKDSIDWQISVRSYSTEMTAAGEKLIALSNHEFSLIESDKGYFNNRSVLGNVLPDYSVNNQSSHYPSLLASNSFFALKSDSGLTVFTSDSCRKITYLSSPNSAAGTVFNNLLCWIDSENTINTWTEAEGRKKLTSVGDSVRKILCNQDYIVTGCYKNVSIFSTDGKTVYKRRLKTENEWFNLALFTDSLILLDLGGSIVAVNLPEGKDKWSIKDNRLVPQELKPSPDLWNSSTESQSGYIDMISECKGILVKNGDRLDLIDLKNGGILKSFPGANRNERLMFATPYKSSLYCFDPFSVKVYSLKTGQALFSDYYSQRIIDSDPGFYREHAPRVLLVFIARFINGKLYMANENGFYVLRID